MNAADPGGGSSARLRLRAEDDDDLEVLSSCLFEALAPVAGMRHDAAGRRFTLALERFTWEKARGDDSRLRQVPCVLVVEDVERVRHAGFGGGRPILSVVALVYDGGTLLVTFDDGAAVRIDVARLRCRFEDTGPGRPPPVAPPHRKDRP